MAVAKFFQGFTPVEGCFDSMPVAAQTFLEELAEHGLIIDHQDVQWPLDLRRAVCGGLQCGIAGGEIEEESRPFSQFALDINRAAVSLHNPVDDGQAKASAA